MFVFKQQVLIILRLKQQIFLMACSILHKLSIRFRIDPILDKQHGLDVIEVSNNNIYNINEAAADHRPLVTRV